MSRQKKLFLVLAALFLLLLGYIAYDISRRTTFPGRRSQPAEGVTQPVDTTGPEQGDTLEGHPENP